MSEEVKIEITADSASAEPALKGTAAGVATVGTTAKAAAPAVRGLAGTIDTLRLSLTTLQKAFGLLGIITLTISWLTALWGVCKKAYEWFNKLNEASPAASIDRMAAAAKAAADEWKKLNEEMARNADQRKALAEDAQKQADATLGLDLANIEEKLQKNLASTTDPAEREDLTAKADAAKTSRTNKASVDAARAARANAQAELIANQKDIDRLSKVASDSSKPIPLSPALQKKAERQKARDAYDSAQKEISKLDEEVAYLRKNARNMGPRATADSFARNQIERQKALDVPSVPDPSKETPSEEDKTYAKAEDERKKRYEEAIAKIQKLRDSLVRQQAMVGIAGTRVTEAETLQRAGMTQAERESADRQADAEAPASDSKASASAKTDSDTWFSRAQERAAAAREVSALEASISETGKSPAKSEALRAAQERAAAADAAIQKANDDLDTKQAEALDTLAKQRMGEDAASDKILASAADKSASVTVDAPRAATDVGAIGGYMGGTMQNAARMAEQRAAALEAIQREALTLLSKIKEGIVE
jgi:hypothetical protein